MFSYPNNKHYSLASELKSNDRLGREGEFYRNVDQRVFGDRPRAGWIVQYNVISYLFVYGLTVHAATNMVLRTFVVLQKTVQSPRWGSSLWMPT